MENRILLRSSWQTRNIGDIAHTPGILQIFNRYLPKIPITLWPCQIDLGVREMLLQMFPGIEIVEGDYHDPAVHRAFERCCLFVHGSGPGFDVRGIEMWRQHNKPYGFFGHSFGGLWDMKKKAIYDNASFIFCRDSLSRDFLAHQEVKCPVVEFGPDATFGIKLRDQGQADDFLRRNNLEAGRFVAVIPRLRYTPNNFDGNNYYYHDSVREQISMRYLQSDHCKLLTAINRILDETDLKILICPEMTYQVSLGKTELYDRIKPHAHERVVWRPEYWLTDEAQTIYSRAHSLISMEMHSPIIFVSEGLPAIYLRQSTDTWKGQMWRDIGLARWILELDNTSGEEIADVAMEIINHYPAAKDKAAKALAFAVECEKSAATQIFALIGHSNIAKDYYNCSLAACR